jgi:hypothetical protein
MKLQDDGYTFSFASTLWPVYLFYIGLMSIIFPTLLVLIMFLVGKISQKIKQGLYSSIIFSLITVMSMPFLKLIPSISGWFLILVSIFIGGLGCLFLKRFYSARLFVTILSISILLSPMQFFFENSDVLYIFSKTDPLPRPIDIKAETPVLLVVFDELPVTSLLETPSAIDAVRFPHFAALARDATWFRNATTVHSQTTGAVPAILTGKFPLLNINNNPHEPTPCANHPPLYTYPEYSKNLFTYMGASYKIHKVEHITRLCPRQLCPTQEGAPLKVLKQLLYLYTIQKFSYQILPLDVYTRILYPVRDLISNGRPAKKQSTNQFQRLVQQISSGSPKSFYYLHSEFPHGPWQFYPSGKQYADFRYLPTLYGSCLKGNQNDQFCSTHWRYETLYRKHLLQVAYSDNLLGQLIDKLKAEGLYERALIIVTADHGISFRQNDMLRLVTPTNAADILSVPLFIKKPYQRHPVQIDRLVRTIDIFPTIADILGTPIPWEIDGVSVFNSVDRTNRELSICSPRYQLLFPNQILQKKFDTLTRKLSLFGSGREKPNGLFAFGPYQQLVGRSPQSFQVEAIPHLRVRLDQPGLFKNVDLHYQVLPFQVEGFVDFIPTAAPKPNVYLALAIDNRIVTVTSVFQPYGLNQYRFATLIPENALKSGNNKISLFEVLSVNTLRRVSLPD